MGLDSSFERAYAKSQLAAGQKLPRSGRVFLSVRDRDKSALVPVARGLHELGFELLATAGTGRRLAEAGVPVRIIPKVSEGRPNIVDHIKDGEIALVINTPSGQKPRRDITTIRAIAVSRGVPLITTMPGAKATFLAIKELKQGELSVRSLQEYHAAIRRA